MLRIDGSRGEGGGQILRTALSLAAATGTPFSMHRIRASRDRPGLRAQHLTALRAAAEICGAELEGVGPGSREIEFRPGPVRPGRYRFDTGGAGSAVLVLQTLLLPLLRAGGESEVDVRGGTHNPFAPPYEFLAKSFLPLVDRDGRRIQVELVRPGFYPAGGGHLRAAIDASGPSSGPLELTDRGDVAARRARALVSDLPRHIGEREVSTAHAFLDLRPDALDVEEVEEPLGPGNAIMIEVETRTHTEVFTGFGRKGVPAEEVALEACREARAFLETTAPVGPYLADQLLLPVALEGGGVYRTSAVTPHARTNAAVIQDFAPVRIKIDQTPDGGLIQVDRSGMH